MSEMISRKFGNIEYKEEQESISYGAHEMRDGMQIGMNSKYKPLIEVKDLKNLENLECFVSLPCLEVNLAKIYVPLKKK